MGRNLDSDIAVYCTQPEGPAVARRMLLRGWSSRREGRRGRKAAKEKVKCKKWLVAEPGA